GCGGWTRRARPLLYEPLHQVVRNQLAGRQQRSHFPPQRSARGSLGAQELTGRDVGHAQVRGDTLGLGSLAAAGRSDDDADHPAPMWWSPAGWTGGCSRRPPDVSPRPRPSPPTPPSPPKRSKPLRTAHPPPVPPSPPP